MDEVSKIVKTTNLDELVFYIDYVEMILDIVKKRDLEDPNLELDHKNLLKRYNELKNGK